MTPYISFIGFARNDEYVADRAKRHNISLNFLAKQLAEYEIPSEIIIVEWNYPEEKLPLAETIEVLEESPWTNVRIIRVPASYHQKYRFWQQKV